MKELLRKLKAVSRGNDDLAAELAHLRREVTTYKHAYETTATDRHRQKGLADNYKYAFETTAKDREIWKAQAHQWRQLISELIGQPPILREIANLPPVIPIEPPSDIPNVFCVGVQKTATSYLYSILRQHPSLQVAPKDENSLRRLHQNRDIDAYRKEVGEPEVGKQVFAHFDVSAIDTRGMASTIKNELCGAARIIICLREPVSRALSEWKMRVRRIRPSGKFVESLDFLDAINAEAQRAQENPAEFFNHFNYTSRSLYAKHIEEFFDAFGRDNVHVVLLDDVQCNPAPTLVRLFHFLSLLDAEALRLALGHHEQFHEASRSPSHISVRLRTADGNILKDPVEAPANVEHVWIDSDVPAQISADVVNPRPILVRDAVQLSRRQAYRLPNEERKALFDRYFRQDIERLQSLLGRDLSSWAP